MKCPTLCKCSACCYCKTAVTKFAPHHTEDKSAGWCSGKRHCYQCRQRRIQGGCVGCISPPAIFKHVFDEFNFFIISNLFNNNKPYALSMHNRKCIIFGETLRFSGKKYKICLKIVQKVLKLLLPCVNFQKFSEGVCPQTPPELFVFSIRFKIILPKKIR